MDCLDKIIKLSRTECACFGDDQPDDFNEGKTEIYLDELEGLNLNIISAAADCTNGSLWNLMSRARENATLAFQADLMSCLENSYSPRRPNYAGLLGKKDFTSNLNITNTKAGQIIRINYSNTGFIPSQYNRGNYFGGQVVPGYANQIVGGKLTIKRIGLALNAVVTVTVNVYDNDQNSVTPIASYDITTVANQMTFSELEEPLVLNLWSQSQPDLKYYIIYEIDGFLPKNNKSICVPCSGGGKAPAYENWIRVDGIRGNGADYTSFGMYSELMGMILDATITCDGSRVICSDDFPLDFTSGKALEMAYAVRFKAGAILCDNILSSSQINRYTMMDSDELRNKRNGYKSKYEQWIQWLCEISTILNNDCWKCKPSSLLARGTLLK